MATAPPDSLTAPEMMSFAGGALSAVATTFRMASRTVSEPFFRRPRGFLTAAFLPAAFFAVAFLALI